MNTATTILELEGKFWEANRQRDVEFFHDHLSEKALAITPFGILDYQGIVGDIGSNPRELFSYIIESPRVMELSHDSALITYKVTTESGSQDKKITSASYVCTVYTRENGHWKACLFQRTPST